MEGYDDIVMFGHVLAKTAFYSSEEPIESLLGYFEKPHKWEPEFQKWKELGGTLDRECVNSFEDWYDHKDDPVDDDEDLASVAREEALEVMA